MFNMGAIFLVVILAVCGLVSGEDFDCPDENGVFPDPRQCDLYYECVEGKAEAKLCPDGLVFTDEDPILEHCTLPFNVDCGNRTELQEPRPSTGCPRQNGYFNDPDPKYCNRFYVCSDGIPTVLECPPNLYFNEKNSNCDFKESIDDRQCA